MSSGTVYPLRPSAPLTDVIGSSPLLPTPVANPTGRTPEQHMAMREAIGRHSATDLEAAVRLLLTPRANDGHRESPRRSNAGYGATIEQAVGLVLSGETSDLRSGAGSMPSDLRLSPWFVEWMMGMPEGWSDPDCLLSATAFSARSGSSPAATSPSASGNE
jgi:hypothetical protein